MKYLYGSKAKNYSLHGDVNHSEGMNFDKRKCTDKCCMVLFVFMVLQMMFISAWAFIYGDMNKVLSGNDAMGNHCGVGEAADYPFVYLTKVAEPGN